MTLRARCCDLEAYTDLQRHMDQCWHCRESGHYCATGLGLVNAYHKAAKLLLAASHQEAEADGR